MQWIRPVSLVALMIVTAPLSAQTAKAPTAPAASHPPEVALVDEGKDGAVYRQTADSLRLYTYDRDQTGKSNCYEGCASAWPPLVAPADSVPVGAWTVVDRRDGFKQWAFKGSPVYMHYHDSPVYATGDGVDGVWHLVPHTQTH